MLSGAALRGRGVEGLLDALSRLGAALPRPDPAGPPEALVYQVRREPSGEAASAFSRSSPAPFRPRDAFAFPGGVEKVHQLRLYRGASFSPARRSPRAAWRA